MKRPAADVMKRLACHKRPAANVASSRVSGSEVADTAPDWLVELDPTSQLYVCLVTAAKLVNGKDETRVSKNPTVARLTLAARNRIIGMRLAGAERQRIHETIRKSHGSSPCLQAVDASLAHHQADPAWDGTNSVAGGRPR